MTCENLIYRIISKISCTYVNYEVLLMKITYFRVKNFRSLRDVEFKDLGNLNIFVGKNSSGKSNVLEALGIFFDDFSIKGGSTTGLDKYCWHNKKTGNPIEFEVKIELSDDEIREIFPPVLLERIKGYSDSLRTLTIKRRIMHEDGKWTTSLLQCSGLRLVSNNRLVMVDSVVRTLIAKNVGDLFGASRKISDIKFSQQFREFILSKISNLIKGRFRLITQIRDGTTTIAHRITLVNPELQRSLWNLDQSTESAEEERCADIETSFAKITGRRLDPARGELYIRRQQRRFPLYLEGGGIQAVMQLVFKLKSQVDRIPFFGIEEPEAHSHSELQRRFFNEIKSLSKNCQLFITTHSPTFVDRTDLGNVWISKFENGETTFERASELQEIVEELGIRPSDVLFFADKILFVEGRSEEIVIPAFAENLGVDLNDVAVLSVEGKNKARLNLKTWVKITRGMLPVFLLLDKDAETEIEELETEGLIKPGRYHVWSQGAIESYYPLPLMEKALNELDQRYSLEMDVSGILGRIKGGELLPDKIDLGAKEKLLDKKLKVLLAESIAKLIRHEKEIKIPEEVRRALERSVQG